MRFGLKCIVTLTILYRAILASQGGSASMAHLAEAAPAAEARVGPALAARLVDWCHADPRTCATDATGLTRLIAGDGSAVASAHPAANGLARAIHVRLGAR